MKVDFRKVYCSRLDLNPLFYFCRFMMCCVCFIHSVRFALIRQAYSLILHCFKNKFFFISTFSFSWILFNKICLC